MEPILTMNNLKSNNNINNNMNKVKDNSTKEFTINELAAIESNIVIFRSCPDISFTTANEINLNYGLVKAAITKHQDKMSIHVINANISR